MEKRYENLFIRALVETLEERGDSQTETLSKLGCFVSKEENISIIYSQTCRILGKHMD